MNCLNEEMNSTDLDTIQSWRAAFKRFNAISTRKGEMLAEEFLNELQTDNLMEKIIKLAVRVCNCSKLAIERYITPDIKTLLLLIVLILPITITLL